MANECKMEFCFRRADIEKLLAANPKAKNIIVSHEIVQEKPRGSMTPVNMVRITARVDPAPKKKAPVKKAAVKSSKLMKGGEDPGTPDDPGTIGGCPFPPGCTD